MGDHSSGDCAWPFSLTKRAASAAGPLFSFAALAARLLRAGMWKPYDCAQSSCLSVWSTHSHLTNALAASTFWLLALTHDP